MNQKYHYSTSICKNECKLNKGETKSMSVHRSSQVGSPVTGRGTFPLLSV
ncbi:hypothetical protein HanPSC8_Chr08g0327301 [Helianthus annuus]|nr:hypothetical protein HanPSC8_Chr08g0327301 [Helianthus annuus]